MPAGKKPGQLNPRAMLGPQKRAALTHNAAFSSLPAELRAQIPPSNIRQRFNAAFDRLARGRSSALQPMRDKDIRVIARTAGAGKIAVISPEQAGLMELAISREPRETYETRVAIARRNIKAYYQRLAGRLKNAGFVPAKLEFEPVETLAWVSRKAMGSALIPKEITSIGFLVKSL